MGRGGGGGVGWKKGGGSNSREALVKNALVDK